MKKLNLLLLLASLFAVGGAKAQAYTELELTTAGWEEVTSLDDTPLSQYYYVFYSVQGENLMLAQGIVTGYHENLPTGVYRTAANPIENPQMVWMIDHSETLKYGLRNLSNPVPYMQSRNDGGISNPGPWTIQFNAEWSSAQNQWTRFNLAYSGGSWTIENNAANDDGDTQPYDDIFIGPWDENVQDPTSCFADGKAVAGNKTGSYVGHFKLYRMEKSVYYGKKYYPEFTAVTSTDQLTAENMANNYYIIVAETNPDLAVTARNRTPDLNVRLKYVTQSVFTNAAQIWTLQANDGGGYSFRNLKKDHGLLQTYSGDNGAYACAILDIQSPEALTKFIPTSDGNNGFTIKNGSHPDNYLGLWNPANGYRSEENMAGNKTATNEIGHFYVYAISRSDYKTQFLANNSEVTDIFMTNPHVENTHGWEGENVGLFTANINNYVGVYNGATDNVALDKNPQYANMHQQVRLPAGSYILKAATRAATIQGDAWLYVYDSSISGDLDKGYVLKKGDQYGALNYGWNWNYMAFTLDSEKTVQIGFYKAQGSWASADDFHLYKVDGREVPQTLIDELAANEQGDEVLMNAAEKAAQSTARATVTESHAFTDFQAMVTAVRTAQYSADTYADMKTRYLDVLTAQLEHTNVYTADAYNQVYGKYLNGEATDEDAAAAHIITDKHMSTYDQLFMPSWKIGDAQAPSNNVFYFNTWSQEGNTDASNFKTPFFEYFVDENSELGVNTLKATQTGLEPDKDYKVSIWVRVRTKKGQTDTNPNTITLQVGDGEQVDAAQLRNSIDYENAKFYHDTYTAYGKTDAAGVLTIKIDVLSGSNVHWLSFKNVWYEKLESIILSENEETYLVDTEKQYNVVVNRNITRGKWATLCLPFAMAKPDGWEVRELSSVEESNGVYTLNFTEATSLVAGKPYMVKTTEDVTRIVATDVEVLTEPVNQTVSGVTMKGVFTSGYVPSGGYFVSGNKFYRAADNTNTMKAFRAYFEINGSNNARSLILNIDEATSVTTLEGQQPATAQPEAVFDLSGRRQTRLVPGINIVRQADGTVKKVFVK